MRAIVRSLVGKHGWVTFRIGTDPNWSEVEALVLGSYLLIAPKKLAAQVGGGAAAPAAAVAKKQQPAATKPAARRTPTARNVPRR